MQVRRVQASLTNKGFREKHGGDHVFLIYHDSDDRKTSIRTKLSRGSRPKDLKPAMQSTLARQCGLSNREFKSLVDCSMSRDDFELKYRLGHT